MVSANLNLPVAIYWIIVIIGGVLFCLTDSKQLSKPHHNIFGKVMVTLSCIVSGANGIYRTVVQQESTPLVIIMFIIETILLLTAIVVDTYKTGPIAIPYILSRYIIGCLIMCTPISLIVTSKALGGFVGGAIVIIIFYIICSGDGGTGPDQDDLITIRINGESYMVLRQYNSMGGKVIEYRDSDGTTRSLSQEGPGSIWYKTEDGESIKCEAGSYFNT